MKGKISVVIIAKNEEGKISDCLKSVSWADEVVVVDSGSEDHTITIAERFGARIINITGGSYGEWRNKGLEEAKGKWILYVDADERATPELKKEIFELISHKNSGAYAIPRRNIILGKEMKHGGQWPDYQKRFFWKKSLKNWRNQIHEDPNFEGELGYFRNPIIHVKHDNITDMLAKTNNWSEIEARLMLESGHPSMNILRFLSAIFREFWLRMVKQKSFLDGSEGVIYAIYQIYSRFISYAKLWEIQLKK